MKRPPRTRTGTTNDNAPYSKRIGPKFTKDKGQHILKNPLAIQSIIDKSCIKATDTVLEVGPGTGNLTVKLLEKAKKVIAVELDPRLGAELIKRVQNTPYQKKLQLIIGDVIKMDLPYFDLCVSNTPYQISSPLLFKLLAHDPPPRASVLMFQREFALRCVAQPGDELYSRLTVNCNMYGVPRHIMKVSPNCFVPPPQVDSSVIRVEPRWPRPQIPFSEWDGFVRLIFHRKNRMLRKIFLDTSALKLIETNYRVWRSLESQRRMDQATQEGQEVDTDMDVIDSAVIRGLVEECLEGIEEERGNKLSLEELLALLLKFNERGIHFRS